ncbi:ribonuclease P protein component [uncultured Prevotella sp.]|uniref:ribonuclease P protein component n=1 Tax=uncultured Prevotella sp. TaxID=159272 RepID=UPI0026370001|nr:ribonuclease P protein component [uncultured Prevotella sp.]
MCEEHKNTLCKEERLHGRDAVEKLFKDAGSRSMVAFPVRVVYVLAPPQADTCVNTRMLVSVPKRQFKRAVKRNRVKRQVREAYRKHKHGLIEAVSRIGEQHLSLAFVWLDSKLYDTSVVEKKVEKLLLRIEEKLTQEKTAG